MDNLIDLWVSLEPNLLETSLNEQFSYHLWNYLGVKYEINPTLSNGIKPDFLIYNQQQKPCLVVETKKRTPHLSQLNHTEFTNGCHNHSLYQESLNQIQEYLSLKDIYFPYGLIFNGDFWQLFKRHDGLIITLTEVQKITPTNLPKLIEQIASCLNAKYQAFTISMWNRKGGVAKTTNTINIAGVLAAMKKRVLVVDFDSQVDLTISLGLNPDNFEDNFLHCLDKIKLHQPQAAKDVLSQWRETLNFKLNDKDYSLDILPGNPKTFDVFGESATNFSYPRGYEMRNKQTALKRILSLVVDEYDYIIIDTPPKIDILTIASLFAADGILIPSDYDPQTLRHIKGITSDFIPEKIRPQREKESKKFKAIFDDINPRILGVIFSNCPKIGKMIEKEIEASLADLPIKIYQNRLRKYDSVTLAKFAQKPVLFYAPNSPATKMYIKLTREIFIEPNFVI